MPFDLDLTKSNIRYGEIAGTGGVDINGSRFYFTASLIHHLKSDRTSYWELAATGAQVVSPLKVRIDEIKGSIRRIQKNYYVDTVIRSHMEKLFPKENNAGQPALFELAKPVAIDWNLTAGNSIKKGLLWSLNQSRNTTDPALKIRAIWGRC